MAIPKLPVILTEADWKKRKSKLAALAGENKNVSALMLAVKLFYDEVKWSAFDVQQALRPTDTAEQIEGQLLLAKAEYQKVPPLVKKLEALEFQAAVARNKFAKNKLIPKSAAAHADQVSKAAKLLATQAEGVQAEYAAFEQAAAGKRLPQPTPPQTPPPVGKKPGTKPLLELPPTPPPSGQAPVRKAKALPAPPQKTAPVGQAPVTRTWQRATMPIDVRGKKPGTKPLPEPPSQEKPPVVIKKPGSKPLPEPPTQKKTPVVTKKPGSKPLPQLPKTKSKTPESESDESQATQGLSSETPLTQEELVRAILKDPRRFTRAKRDLQLAGVNLAGANLAEASFAEADLTGANLSKAILRAAYFNSATMRDANLNAADLTQADLFRADLGGADLSQATLTEVKGTNAKLLGAKLVAADLTRAVFDCGQFEGADLSNATLTDVNLHTANLRQANFTGANLRGAILEKADLTGAQGLTEEQLAPVDSLKGATMPDGTKHN